MVKLIQQTADRLVGMVVPKVDVQAPACDCTPNETWWGDFCYCAGIHAYVHWCKCNGNCVGAYCYCRVQGNWC